MKYVLTRLFQLSFPSHCQKLKLNSNRGIFLKSHDGTSASRGETLKKGGRAEREEPERRVQSYAGRQVETEVDQPDLIDASALFSFDCTSKAA